MCPGTRVHIYNTGGGVGGAWSRCRRHLRFFYDYYFSTLSSYRVRFISFSLSHCFPLSSTTTCPTESSCKYVRTFTTCSPPRHTRPPIRPSLIPLITGARTSQTRAPGHASRNRDEIYYAFTGYRRYRAKRNEIEPNRNRRSRAYRKRKKRRETTDCFRIWVRRRRCRCYVDAIYGASVSTPG